MFTGARETLTPSPGTGNNPVTVMPNPLPAKATDGGAGESSNPPAPPSAESPDKPPRRRLTTSEQAERMARFAERKEAFIRAVRKG